MEAYKIEGNQNIPRIILDKNNNRFEFVGKSIPENVSNIFDPVMDWLEEYSKSPNPETKVEFEMEYYNTASSKMILEILILLNEMNKLGNKVHIKWYYRKDDPEIEEAGEEYQSMIDLPFELIPIKEPFLATRNN